MAHEPLASLLPPPHPATSARVRRAVLFWLLGCAILLVLVRLDVVIVAQAARYGAPSEHPLINGLRDLAEYGFISAVCLAIVVFDRRRLVILPHVLFALLLGFGIMALGKIMVNRVRPVRLMEGVAELPWSAGWNGIH